MILLFMYTTSKTNISDLLVTLFCMFLLFRHTTSETNISDLQMDEFLFSIRKLIEDTCYIVLIFMSVIIIKELLGTVIWLYMKRFVYYFLNDINFKFLIDLCLYHIESAPRVMQNMCTQAMH